MKAIRVYSDTSVFGGVHDEEFRQPSRTFFEQVNSGRFALVTSAVVQAELIAAPAEVKMFFNDTLKICELVDVTSAALELRDAYLQAGILTPKYATDALHVALATVSVCDLIISWNFQHIVHFEKIPLYNAINTLHGYKQVAIYSPQQVIRYEEEI